MLKREKFLFSKNLRGQITVFIIIGVVILSGVVLYFIFSGGIKNNNQESSDVEAFVQNCVDKVSKDSLIFIGEHGGYYNIPENSIYYFPYLAPVYMDKYKSYIPGKEIVSQELSLYFNENVLDCFENFSGFPNKKVEAGNVNSEISFNKDSVDFDIKIPLTVRTENSTEYYSDFSSVQKLDFNRILDLSMEIVSSQVKNPKYLCVSCLNEISTMENTKIKIIETLNKNEFVFLINESNSKFSNEGYRFYFGMRHDFNCNGVEECSNEI